MSGRLAKAAVSCVLAATMAAQMTAGAAALENKTETIWGSLPVTAYMTMKFYEDGNTIKIPRSYFNDMDSTQTLKENIMEAYQEAIKQGCYLYGDKGLTISANSSTVTITRRTCYDLAYEEGMRSTVEAEANRVLSEILYDGMSDYQKAVAIYKYVVDAATYDWDAYYAINGDDCYGNIEKWAKSISAYGVLIMGKSVCQGDAQAFTLLARKAGLTAIMATGTMPGGGKHSWNRVWINDRWYEVDCCYGYFCSDFASYQASTGMVYGGEGIVEVSESNFYG